jgi:protein TonB
MAEQTFLDKKTRSPGSLVIVIALHGAAITALMLSKMEYHRIPTVITKTYPVDETIPPPPEKIEPQKPQPHQQVQSRLDTVQPIVDRPVFTDLVLPQPPTSEPVTFDPSPPGPVTLPPAADPPPVPKADPVRTEAQFDPRSKLQPPYPAAEERAEVTGSVTVMIVIGSDGRVKAVDKVSAGNDAFYRATQQQALRYWRFKPAMVDGKPVESRKRMTVHFRLDA